MKIPLLNQVERKIILNTNTLLKDLLLLKLARKHFRKHLAKTWFCKTIIKGKLFDLVYYYLI